MLVRRLILDLGRAAHVEESRRADLARHARQLRLRADEDRLDSQLRYSPMAFRVWRAITKLVRLSEDGDAG